MRVDSKKASSFWIIGAGRFGSQGVRSLIKADPRCRILLIDRDPKRLEGWGAPVETVLGEGIEYLVSKLKENAGPDWIVPAIPIHVAFEWARRALGDKSGIQRIRVPARIGEDLPNPFFGKDGALYVSYADFICPANCRAPADYCTVTKKPRGVDLWRRIADLNCGLPVLVIESRQLAPGLGGYPPQDLFRIATELKRLSGEVLIATASRCHGVIHAMKINAPQV